MVVFIFPHFELLRICIAIKRIGQFGALKIFPPIGEYAALRITQSADRICIPIFVNAIRIA